MFSNASIKTGAVADQGRHHLGQIQREHIPHLEAFQIRQCHGHLPHDHPQLHRHLDQGLLKLRLLYGMTDS